MKDLGLDEELIPLVVVLAMGAGRWKDPASLAAATRAGTGPPGRVLLTPNRAAYRKRDVETWFAAEEKRREEVLERLRENAAKARAARAARIAGRPIVPTVDPSSFEAPE